MKTVEITTETMPWVHGAPQAAGSVVDVEDNIAEILVGNGHAKIVAKRRPSAAPAPEQARADV